MSETEYPLAKLASLLAEQPPYVFTELTDENTLLPNKALRLDFPVLSLHCDSEHCGGVRSHDPRTEAISVFSSEDAFVDYRCRHCRTSNKTYAVSFWCFKNTRRIIAQKIGEAPPYGPHTPTAVLRLLGADKELYLKGRRAESQGLGIAAFAYYRRVVENHKDGLIDEILRVSRHLNAADTAIVVLEKAKAEISFEKSVEMIKDGIPPSLLLKGGHNPLQLLHTALSMGLHNDDDAECLELAVHIRTVLLDFVERVQSSLRESAELNAAVSKLLQKKAGVAKPTK